jgi:hypothetical protein
MAAPEPSCAQLNALLDVHIERVRQRWKALRTLEKELVALRGRCDDDLSHSGAILDSFTTAAEEHACACHPHS